TEVVIYDSKGLFSAARAWWMFQVYGHHTVQILAEGLPGWLAAGLAIESGQVTAVRAESEFVPERQSGWLADLWIAPRRI
ncbi:MAG: sulfurtransferase, partial [Marivivens sp.]|nr:sulfurtransferase [Marivivens sp.]